jgi:hypothetical protein
MSDEFDPRVLEAVAELNAMPADGDKEGMHARADALLLGLVPTAVADAWRAANCRCNGWWYA